MFKYSLRHITAWVSAALLLLGCAGESYPGLEYDHVLSPDIINNESGRLSAEGVPIEVYIRPQKFVTATTRGAGPFDIPVDTMPSTRADSNRYEKSMFYVFAFRDTLDWQGYPATDFTKHVNDANDANDKDANCLVDAGEKPHGMPAYLDYDRSGHLFLKRLGNTKLDTTMYYGPAHREAGYNFFAYYVDDLPLEGKMHRGATGIWYDVELDGTRDIMLGHAPKITPELLDTAYAEVVRELDIKDRRHILNIGNYSNVSAQWSIHPYINLEHALTRLRFKAYPADRSCDSVYIESIEIECRNKGSLYVVAPYLGNIGFSPTDERAWVPLYEKNPTTNRDSVGIAPYLLPLDTLQNHVSWKPGMEDYNWIENPYVTIGGDMMVATDTLYNMRLVYRQILREKDPVTGQNRFRRTTAHFQLPAPAISLNYNTATRKYYYRPGYVYNINIGVFGLRPIEIKITLEGWEEGGTIYVGEDDEIPLQ